MLRKHGVAEFDISNYEIIPQDFANAANTFITNYWIYFVKQDKELLSRYKSIIELFDDKVSDDLHKIRNLIYTIYDKGFSVDNFILNDKEIIKALSIGDYNIFKSNIKQYIKKHE